MLCKLFLAVQQIIQNLNSQTADIGYLTQCMRIRILGGRDINWWILPRGLP